MADLESNYKLILDEDECDNEQIRSFIHHSH